MSKQDEKSIVKSESPHALLADLNNEQIKAVTHAGGPLLIIAGAGTGKTTVITKRIAWLILEQGISAEKILALTFTNKAAEEMEMRVDKLLPYGYTAVHVSTFHTFAQEIVKQHAFDIGLAPDAELLDSAGQWLLIRKNFKRFDLDYYRPHNNPNKFIKAMLAHFSRLKDEEITPAQYLEYAEGLMLSQDDAEGSRGRAKKVSTPVRLGRKGTKGRLRGKNKDITPSSSPLAGGEVNVVEAKRVLEIANAYHTYQQLLLENNKMDFGDLVHYCLRIFRERPTVLKQYQVQFEHVLVDEFQDTNWAQYELVKMLSLPQNNIAVVADDDQSIYRFRGASMSNVLQFSKDFPKVQTVSLITNYRSGQEILDSAYSFIQLNNPNRLEFRSRHPERSEAESKDPALQSAGFLKRDPSTPARVHAFAQDDVARQADATINKKLIAHTKDASRLVHLHAKTGADEARAVVDTMLELKEKDTESTWNDFVILVRANNHADLFEEQLAGRGIPHQNFSAAGLYKTTLIANILAFFDVLDDYHESRAVFRLLYVPFLDIAAEDIIKLTHYANKKRVPLYSVVREPRLAGIANEHSLDGINKIADWIAVYADMAKRKKPTLVLHDWLTKSGYMQFIQSLPEEETIGQYRLLRAFWDHISDMERALVQPHIVDVVELIHEEQKSGEDGTMPVDLEAGPELARIMTIHTAKGLEFKYVFIVNMVDRRFPTTERREAIEIPDALIKETLPKGDAHLEEERRLFYVALTRAKRGIFLTSAENYGGTQKKKFSKFLIELAKESKHVELAGEPLRADVHSFLPTLVEHGRGEFVLPIPKKFSYTQLKIFDTDPFEYKLQFIYKVPTPGKHMFSYGNTMHATLQQFFQRIAEKQRAVQANLFGESSPPVRRGGQGTEGRLRGSRVSNITPSRLAEASAVADRQDDGNNMPSISLAELLTLYDKNWIEDWYETEQQKKEYKARGKKSLQTLYMELSQGPIPNVQSLERAFNVRIGDYTIIGRMDRVDALPNGKVRIVDYKTGTPKEKLNEDDKRQLLIYQIAAEEVFGEQVEALVYYYLDNNTAVSFLGTDDEKDEVKQWIINIIQKIHASDFEPNRNNFFPELSDYYIDLHDSGRL